MSDCILAQANLHVHTQLSALLEQLHGIWREKLHDAKYSSEQYALHNCFVAHCAMSNWILGL